MKETSSLQLEQHLKALRVSHGQNVYVHSNMSALGLFRDGPEGLYDVLRGLIGDNGTIVSPAYRITAPRDEPYISEESPSLGVGAFSEFLRKRRGSTRTLNPIHSHVIDGPLSNDWARRSWVPSFGPGSDFEYLFGKQFLGLYLGCNFQSAGTMVFHAQACANTIPYREWQTLSRFVSHGNKGAGTDFEGNISLPYYARISGAPKETRLPVELMLGGAGLLIKEQLPYGYSLSFDCDRVQLALVQTFKQFPDLCTAKATVP